MNELHVNLSQAQARADKLVTDLEKALMASRAIERPEGRSIRDNALSLYLAESLTKARELNERLSMLGIC